MKNFLRSRRLRQFLSADEGQALVLTALGLMMLLMMAALGVDVGYLHYQKQQMQKAADAGAIAAATVLAYSGDYTDAAYNDTAANGFANGMKGVTVTVNNPPLTQGDPFQNNDNYVEVIIAQAQPTFFMRVNGINSVNVRARAVANSQGNASGCLYALDPSDSSTFVVGDGVNLTTNCGIYVNSSDPTALVENGSGSVTVSANGAIIGGVGIGVVGGYSGSSFVPTPTKGIPTFTDPLSTLPAQATPSSCPGQLIGTTYSPAVYCNLNVPASGGPYTFTQGTYVILGGMTVPSTTAVTGAKVTFYITSSAANPYTGVNIGSNSGTSLSAPTTGPYQGVLFFQDRNNVSIGSAPSYFDISSGGSLTGALYFSTTKVSFTGSSGGAPSFSPIDAYEIEFQGTAYIKNNFLSNNGSPIPGATLVE